MTLMSLATAAKEGSGSGPQPLTPVPPPLQGGCFQLQTPDQGCRLGPALLQCMEMSCGAASGLEVGWGSLRLSGDRPLSSEMTGTAVHSLFQLILCFYLGVGWLVFF